MIGGRKKSWFKGGERTRKARGMEPISLGFRRSFSWLSTTLLEADRSAIPPLADSDQKLFRRLRAPSFPNALDGIESGRYLPLKVETHALFRYAPCRQDPSFSFPEVIRKGMEDGPLRACLRLPARMEGEGKRSANIG